MEYKFRSTIVQPMNNAIGELSEFEDPALDWVIPYGNQRALKFIGVQGLLRVLVSIPVQHTLNPKATFSAVTLCFL